MRTCVWKDEYGRITTGTFENYQKAMHAQDCRRVVRERKAREARRIERWNLKNAGEVSDVL